MFVFENFAAKVQKKTEPATYEVLTYANRREQARLSYADSSHGSLHRLTCAITKGVVSLDKNLLPIDYVQPLPKGTDSLAMKVVDKFIIYHFFFVI